MNTLLKAIGTLLLSGLTFYANALYIDSEVFTLESNKTFFSRTYLNNTDRTNLYKIHIYKIEKPGGKEKDEVQLPIENGEILYTPLQKVLLPGEHEFFKLFYKGISDNKERYYRIIIEETPVNLVPYNENTKQPLVVPTVGLNTVMVIRPRELNFAYNHDNVAGTITNTGNTYFRLLLNDKCDSDEENAKILQLLPGESYQHPWLKKEHKQFIIAFDRYISLENGCNTN
ncbi:fimbrial protein [Proteus hauseri]|uniref:fimbrial protein n=1 Tax=Proteus hauseri TaxID=183417 RepID=UPI0032DAC702